MMNARLIGAVLTLIIVGCSSPPAPKEPDVVPAATGGLSLESYRGAFSEMSPLDRADPDLRVAADEAIRLLQRRLGIDMDSDRPRRLGLSDKVAIVYVETRILNGRMVQMIQIPAARIAQGRSTMGDLVTEGICAAVLTDPEWSSLPAWFAAGAPGWLSGSFERSMYERALDPGSVDLGYEAVLPAMDPLGGPADSVSAAAFFRFLAEEFGAARLPDLATALSGASTAREGLSAALGTDPVSLPVAFDGYRARVASDLLDDPVLGELRAASAEGAASRIRRLSGLSARARSPYVAAAALEALGRAQFEAGAFEDAADTFARVERDHVQHALDLAGDRYLFALCFIETGQPEAAALRLSTFIDEFPGSVHAADARAAVASILVEEDRIDEAIALYQEVVAPGTGSAAERSAHLALGRLLRKRFRYADAERHLRAARPDPAADAELESLKRELRSGLPQDAVERVRSALSAIAADPDGDVSNEIAVVLGVGPLAGATLDEFASRVQPVACRLHFVSILSTWPRDDAEPRLARYLGDVDPGVARAAVDGLLGCGLSERELLLLLDGHPGDVSAARAEYERRFGANAEMREVAPLIGSDDHRERMEGAYRLSSVDGVEAMEALVTLSRDPSPPVRRAAAAALGGHDEARAKEILIGMLGDDATTVRLEAYTSLSRLGRRDLVRERGPEDADPRVRVAVAVLMLGTSEEEDLERVVGMLEDEDGAVRNSVEEALRVDGGEALAPFLADALGKAEEPGLAMRLVRVMSHMVDGNLDYDPTGGIDARERTAAQFLDEMRPR